MGYLHLGDNLEFMATLPDERVDLTCTSPPYDDLHNMAHLWDFPAVAHELFRITKPHCCVIWIVGDQRKGNCRSGTTARQQVYFTDEVGFKLAETIIMVRSHTRMPNPFCHANIYETALVLSKGKPRKPNVLRDERNLTAGQIFNLANHPKKYCRIALYGRRTNVWYYPVGGSHTSVDKYTKEHPCRMPERFARDHIRTWSNPGELVFDPFSGAGTTGKLALKNGRDFIGCEIDRYYHDIACQRLQEFAVE